MPLPQIKGGKFGSPSLACDTITPGCNHFRRLIVDIPHSLSMNDGVGVERPFQLGRAWGVVERAHRFLITKHRAACPD